MSGPIRRTQIVEAVKALHSAIEAWEQLPLSNAPTMAWGGQVRKVVSQDIQDAAANLFEFVSTAAVERDAWPLVLAIDSFADRFEDWAQNCNRAPDKSDPGGSPEVWGAWQVVLQELSLRHWKHPEPIGALLNLRPPPTHEKIARMYGWVENGIVQVHKVQEELTEPGKHYDPNTWIHPSEKKFMAGLEVEWGERCEKLAARPRDADDRGSVLKSKAEAPESIEQLIRAGVNSDQICKMKRVSKEEVRALAAELGVPLDGNVVADVFRGNIRTDDEQEIARKAEAMRIAGLNSYAELGTDQTARILAMHADGQRPGDITRALESGFPGLTVQKVNTIIKRASQEAAAAK